ncbi:MAG: hypothetical protein WBS33_00915 [Verrucomicrobiia bacterium]
MRLLKQSGAGWKYELNQNEGILLRTLVKEFPLTAATAVKISRTGSDAKSVERERLLNESLGSGLLSNSRKFIWQVLAKQQKLFVTVENGSEQFQEMRRIRSRFQKPSNFDKVLF